MSGPGEPRDSVILPRALLLAAGGLVALAILGAGLSSGATARAAVMPPGVTAVRSLDLGFEDRTDGGIQVTDMAAGRPVETLAPGTNGFIRGALRGLARERRRQGFGPEIPMRLTEWSDGSLTLEDLATRERIEVNSFGSTNAEAFRGILLRDR
jgi:putative photosynthetic complex assembly protein